MKAALQRVKKALTVSNLAPQLAYVSVHNGWMSATDGRLYASAPCDCAYNFVAPGKELDKALNFHADVTMEYKPAVDGNPPQLVFKHKRSRIKIQCLPEDSFARAEAPQVWANFTPGYLEALKRARVFVSDNATQGWAMGVMNHKDFLAATNNIVLAVIDFKDPPVDGTVPFWLIDYVAAMPDQPVGVHSDPNAIFFLWADGSWLRSLRIEGEAPAQMKALIENLSDRDRAIWQIPDEWREVYKQTLGFASRNIEVGPSHIRARGEATEVETEIFSPVEDATLWDHRFLGPVLAEATHWDISSHPQPAFWYGDKIRGVVVGKVVGV